MVYGKRERRSYSINSVANKDVVTVAGETPIALE